AVVATWDEPVGNPSGVTYELEEGDSISGPWTTALGTTGSSPFQYERTNPGGSRGIRIRATKSGYTPSAWVARLIAI
ncbi:MAG TPA: hypothetical protein PK788_11795, partial [Gemmatimonadaceae bacterium]|nr:hypothetical protein [Gemmatimonadaceae bacterium]